MKTFHFRTFLATLALPGLIVQSSAGGAIKPEKSQILAAPDAVPKGLANSDWQSIRAAYDAGRHAFQPVAGGWQARNPGQRWTAKFDGRGFIAEPQDGGWQWGLELQSYGFGEKQQIIRGTSAVNVAGTRFTCEWDANVQEWFVNDQRGLEHGFTVRERPAEIRNTKSELGNSLTFSLAVRGTLQPRVSADAQGVQFHDASGATIINYAGLKVWDADGKVLSSHFTPPDPRHPSRVILQVNERHARYPITIDPIAQQAYLKASNLGVSDQFGYSVAVSGDTVVIGAPLEGSGTTGVNSTPDESAPGSGAAYVFVRTGTTWTQQAYLKASNTRGNDKFGESVAVSGDTVVVGAPYEDGSIVDSGAAYVFVRTGTTWTLQSGP